MASSNLAILTQAHKAIASKRKAKREQIKEIVFDDDARREFLTGFHKRKVQKKEAAKSRAKEREKLERLEARREHRRMLAEQAKKNSEEAERAYGGITGSDDEWDGLIAGVSKEKMNDEELEEYENEEQLATVTVVEEFDPDSLIHGTKPPPKSQSIEDIDDTTPTVLPHAKAKRAAKDTTTAKVKKAKEVKYQTSAARKAERTKQRKRKLEKAERAGGKSSRKKPKGARGKR